MTDAKFIPGLLVKDKHERAPEFVICKGSIKVADLAAWLSGQSDEWVNFDVKRSRDGKLYLSIDDWKPNSGGGERRPQQRQQQSRQAPPADDFSDDDIPF